MEIDEELYDIDIIDNSIMNTYKQNYNISKQYDGNEKNKKIETLNCKFLSFLFIL